MLDSLRGKKSEMLVLHKLGIAVVTLLLTYTYYKTPRPVKLHVTNPTFATLGPCNITEPVFQVDDVYEQLIDLKSFTFKLNPQPCQNNSAGLLLVVIIPSNPTNYEKRMVIRNTWGRSLDSTKVVFLIGESDNSTVSQKLQYESAMLGDIVQGTFKDAYRNMTYKHVMGLKWVSHHCPTAKYILKVDDDVVVSSHELRRFLVRELSPWSTRDLILCPVLKNEPVQRARSSKWFLSVAEYPSHFYPTYCVGWAVIYSMDVVPRLLKAAQFSKYFWIDDVHVTGELAEKIGVPRTPLGSLALSPSRAYTLKTLGAAHVGQFLFGPPDNDIAEMNQIWNAIVE